MATSVNASKSQKPLAESPHILFVGASPAVGHSLSGNKLVKLPAEERADGGELADRRDSS